MFDTDTETGTIRAYGMIGDEDINFESFQRAFASMGGQDVTIELDSEGGNVRDGFNLYNLIEQYSGSVTVQINAWAASIASYFPMAADRVLVYANSRLMIHNAWTIALGDASEMRAVADVLEMFDADLAYAYARKTGKDTAYFRDLMDKETYFTAEQAVGEGLVDGITSREPQNLVQGPARLTVEPFLDDQAMAELRRKAARPKMARHRAALANIQLSLGRLDK